jgi:hypothetical protein
MKHSGEDFEISGGDTLSPVALFQVARVGVRARASILGGTVTATGKAGNTSRQTVSYTIVTRAGTNTPTADLSISIYDSCAPYIIDEFH